MIPELLKGFRQQAWAVNSPTLLEGEGAGQLFHSGASVRPFRVLLFDVIRFSFGVWGFSAPFFLIQSTSA